MLRVVRLHRVHRVAVAPEVGLAEAHVGELGVGREHRGVLALERRHRRVERDEVRHRLREADCEDVLPVAPRPREHLASRDDQQVVVREAVGALPNLWQVSEVGRVHEYVESAGFRAADDALVEHLDVAVDVAVGGHALGYSRTGLTRCGRVRAARVLASSR